MTYANVAVTITRYVDNNQPGWVDCELRDIEGHVWHFNEVKQVYVSETYLDAETAYPVTGQTTCRVLNQKDGVATIDFVHVDLPSDDITSIRVAISELSPSLP